MPALAREYNLTWALLVEMPKQEREAYIGQLMEKAEKLAASKPSGPGQRLGQRANGQPRSNRSRSRGLRPL